MQKIIIDTDPGIDDSLAILMALNSPELDVIGITVVEGNVPTEIGVQNALKVLEEAGRLDIPVFKGATAPLKHEYVSAQDTHGLDGLGESDISSAVIKMADKDASSAYEQLLTDNEDVWLLALGPLTNIAISMQKTPEVWQNMSRLIIMGGAYQSNGNTSPVAEYNFWVDPDAADYVLNSSPIVAEIVPLDITRKMLLTPNILSLMQRLSPDKSVFITKIIQFYFDFHWTQEHVLGAVINDPLVIVHALYPEYTSGISKYVTVVTEGIALGQSIVDVADIWHMEANAVILTRVDSLHAMSEIIARLLNIPIETVLTEINHIATTLEALS
ncbi:inosine-uridine preferring nucleoside hydrolase [Leuconostoc litchii]|uniref:Nucleoside hydrolase n=1 Tax=Leuconostoc litchii TaxID=1981069 RepID=A0A6P2CQM0_9LACO|nr:nucleoside hydrolase [Leuconostoc litchii]TYC47181.1 nucleoside hydrolase [Leuconostoc litchii]GMA69146.1 inosine-uridine preferring nucleoside hydrolase [Leuconostoc litchii]